MGEGSQGEAETGVGDGEDDEDDFADEEEVGEGGHCIGEVRYCCWDVLVQHSGGREGKLEGQ